MRSFSVHDSVINAWKLFRAHWFFLISSFVLMAIASLIPSFVADFVSESNFVFSLVFRVLGWVVGTVTAIGVLTITLHVVDGKQVFYKDLFTGYRLFVPYLVTSLLVGLVVLIGFFLLVIPGLFLAAKLQFALYYVIDKGMGPIAAIRASWQITKGNILRIMLLDLVVIALSVLGMAFLGIGLLFTIPIGLLAVVYAYRQLTAASS